MLVKFGEGQGKFIAFCSPDSFKVVLHREVDFYAFVCRTLRTFWLFGPATSD
jgi:hypothetical protein